jgi:polo-like kinase 1
MTFLKKWKKAKKAILFRLSNRIIQVMFQDQSELIICTGSGMVTFVNSRKNIKILPLNSELSSQDSSLFKRLQYSKEVLMQMVSST